MARLVELHHAEALRVVHVVAEHRGAVLARGGLAQQSRQAAAVEDVVAQDKGAAITIEELLTDDESLGQTVRRGLHGIGHVHAERRAILEQLLEVGQIGRGGDEQDVANARQHENGQRVVHHGLIVHGQQLFRCDLRQRVQARAGAACQNNAFHVNLVPCRRLAYLY